MNTKDKKDLEQVLVRLSQQDTSRSSQMSHVQSQLDDLKSQNKTDHAEIHKLIKAIDKSLLHPQEGVWAHLNLNTSFRTTLSHAMWVIIPALAVGVGGGIVALILFFGPAFAAVP